MKSINEIQDDIIEEFEFFDDWMDKYEYLISMGKTLPLVRAQFKTDENLIKGCQSRVWLHSDVDSAGRVMFTGDSDAIITKGIISMLIRVLSGHQPLEIAKSELYFVEKIGLKDHLSPTRSNGLSYMMQKMKMYGLAYAAKSEI